MEDNGQPHLISQQQYESLNEQTFTIEELTKNGITLDPKGNVLNKTIDWANETEGTTYNIVSDFNNFIMGTVQKPKRYKTLPYYTGLQGKVGARVTELKKQYKNVQKLRDPKSNNHMGEYDGVKIKFPDTMSDSKLFDSMINPGFSMYWTQDDKKIYNLLWLFW